MNRRPSYASVAAGGGRSNLSARIGMLAHGSGSGSGASSSNPSSNPLSPSFDDMHDGETASQLPHSNISEPPVVRLGQIQQPVHMNAGSSLEASSAAVEGSIHHQHRFAQLWEYEMERNDNLALYGRHTTSGSGQESFLMPAYLHGSRYMRKRVESQNAREAARREAEAASGHYSHRPSRSSSTTNLIAQKMVPSHRGMTYEVVEARPPEGDSDCAPIPSKWDDGGLDTFADGLGLKWPTESPPNAEYLSAQGDHHIPPECGIYYYEVLIDQLSKGGAFLAVGMSAGKPDLKKLPGWEAQSWAYHGDDGTKFGCGHPRASYDKPFGKGETIGCGVNFWTKSLFFTRNGHRLEDAFQDIVDSALYPHVGMKVGGGSVLVNFGQEPFKYNIMDEVTQEKAKLKKEIQSVPLTNILQGRAEDNFVKELVAQFLRHGGYVETAKAFTTEVHTEHRALGTETTISGNAAAEDIDAAQRQRIRSAVLAGDVDRAIKCTQDFYPDVLEQNPIIHFRLKAMRFLEVVRLVTSAGRAEPMPVSPYKKDKAKATLPGSSAMDVDQGISEPATLPLTANISRSISWPPELLDENEPMDMSSGNIGMQGSSLSGDTVHDLQMAILEGQRLSEEYDKDQRREVRAVMRHIKGIWAYEDPTDSKEVGYLFKQNERVKVSEELNSAILVTMGKSSAAAIERMAQQTEVLIENVTVSGHAGAFINLERDLQ